MSMGSRRGTRSKQRWAKHLQRAQAQGIPLVQYCRERNLNVQSLYNARYELSKQGLAPRVSRSKAKVAEKFVEVRMAPTDAAAAPMAYRVRVKGCVIECATLPPSAWLTSLISGDADAVP